ncbi:hypothetical protein OBBRIDRAFT_732258, partial [Obba rivulosa]
MPSLSDLDRVILRTFVPLTAGAGPAPVALAQPTSTLPVSFPPHPRSLSHVASVIRAFTTELYSASLRDSVCSVCAQLHPSSDVQWRAAQSFDFSLLDRSGTGCVRAERLSSADLVPDVQGFILEHRATRIGNGGDLELQICGPCERSLRKKRMPVLALANGLWLGDVPPVLRDLSFVEKLCISRYRHNICVVKLSQGQRKLSGNAIVFGQPI